MRRAPIESDEMPSQRSIGALFRLPERVAHYLRDVLRMQVGDRVELFDGTGRIIIGELSDVENDLVRVRVEHDRVTERGESPCEVTLVQAIPKGKRWEMVLEKATELGVSHVVPLESKRTVVQISDTKVDRKLDRWGRVIEAAARQCERTVTPDVVEPVDLDSALELLGETPCFVAHTGEEVTSLGAALDTTGLMNAGEASVAIFVGPEGGFDDTELKRLTQAGAVPFHMGPRVLRSETAGVVAVALMQAHLGDLR
jgi:16S rRNA (uracil1498-N3)-methyltransferase